MPAGEIRVRTASQTTELAVGTPGRDHTQLAADRKRPEMPIENPKVARVRARADWA
jgi:hypothetical protein